MRPDVESDGWAHLYRLGVNTVTDRSIGEIQPGLAVR